MFTIPGVPLTLTTPSFAFASLAGPAGSAAAHAEGDPDEQAVQLDGRRLADLRQLDPDGHLRLLQRVMETYLHSLAQLMSELNDAHERGDLEALLHAAHTLKSPSASVGAMALHACCARTEAAVRECRLEEVPGLIVRLRAEARGADAAVRRLLAG